MGVFIYNIGERRKLEEVLKKENIERTDAKIKFSPSSIEKLSRENVEALDRCGIQSSSIQIISSFNEPRKNSFIQIGTKEIPNQRKIPMPKIDGWRELNILRFGHLNSIYKSGRLFTPYQEIEYWGLRNHLAHAVDAADFIDAKTRSADFQKKIRLVELDCKFHELTINHDELDELAKLTVDKIIYKTEIINREIQKSDENIRNVGSNFKGELEELRKCCYPFEEDVIAYGDKSIFLTFERFVHIYARHVSETQIGEVFSGEKTVFQYKFEDIKYLLKMVVVGINDEIQEHFKMNPDQLFRRMGSRAVYTDGHYYRLVIDPTGSIQDFHPYNRNEE